MTIPPKITLSFNGRPVTYDSDLVRKHAPSEYRAVVEAGASLPRINLVQLDTLSKGQFERDDRDAWIANAKLAADDLAFINEHLAKADA